MCVVSMVMDHQWDEWNRRYHSPDGWITKPFLPPASVPAVPVAVPTKDEIEEFRRLLDRAREYDRKNNEPDCELEEKKQKLLDLAKQLGVDINFL